MADEWVEVGTIEVDGGMMLLIDPADLDETYAAQGDRYTHELLPIVGSAGQFGAGVVVPTGFGDGTYTVEARLIPDPQAGTRVAEVRVRFIIE